MTMKPAQIGEEVQLRKGPWMPEEDEILVEYVRQHGARDWSSIRSKGLLPRTGKSCRLRWVNKLKPDLKRSGCKFSPEEEKLVVEMQARLGNKWAKIASYLPGRTDNDVKNFWSTRQKRILRALQRPKTQKSSTDPISDHPEIGTSPFLTDFSGFQMNSPSGPPGLLPATFGAPYLFGDEDRAFRDQEGLLGDVQTMIQHNPSSFNIGDVDNMLMVKLQDLVANDPFLLDSSDFPRTARLITDDGRHNSVIVPIAANPRSSRSVKRRPRSRRESRTGFESVVIEDPDMQLLPEIPLLQTCCRDFGIDLYDEQPGHEYCNFLLPDASAGGRSNQGFCSELPNFMSPSNQWEKLPLLYSSTSHEPSLPECSTIKKEEIESSCSPDSVVAGFPADVFDSLEPLSPNSSEWWVYSSSI